MTTTGIIFLVAVMLIGARVVWKIALKHSREELARQSKGEEVAPVAPVVVPENDKEWHIRTDIVEGMRASIIRALESSPSLLVDTESVDGHEFALTHGEICALIAPFLQKGYFAYRDIIGYREDRVTRFKISKHRFPGSNALEITEELLTKNAQL